MKIFTKYMLVMSFITVARVFGYSPPLPNATVNLVTISSTSHYYSISVYDPIAGVNRSTMSGIISGAPAASNAQVIGGMVVVIYKTASQNAVSCYTYDPKRGQWMGTTLSKPVGNYVSYVAGDGVVAVSSYNGMVTTGWDIQMVTYDPNFGYAGTPGTWISGSFFTQPSSSSRQLVVDNGVVAWRVSYNNYNDHKAGFAIYDPVTHSWKSNTKACDSNYFVVSNGSVTIDPSIGTVTTYGYDPYTSGGVWYSGNTKSLSFFVTQTVGMSAIVTDMSIGGNSWLWDFGDGTTSNSRSDIHNYTVSPPVTVQQDISGIDSQFRTSSFTINSF